MTDIYINDLGGYRILMKNSNLFSTSFSTDFMFKYYPSTSSNPTFPSNQSRLLLFSMGGGTSLSNKGVHILLETFGGKEYITGIYNSNQTSEWTYLPNLNNGDTNSVNGIEVSYDYYYLVTFNMFKGNSQNVFTYQLNVIQGPTETPTIITRNGSGINEYINYQPQAGFGSPNESISETQVLLPNINYGIGDDEIIAYTCRNIAFNYIRLWDGNVNTSSTIYNPTSLFVLDEANTIITVDSPTTSYPQNVGGSVDDSSPDFQRLAFQLNSKSSSNLSNLYNTAYFTSNTLDGEPATLTKSPTGYSTLADFALNSEIGQDERLSLEISINGGADPHMFPYFKPNYDINEEGTFLYFLYTDENGNYTKLHSSIKIHTWRRHILYYNDIVTLYEKKGNLEYTYTFNFNQFLDNPINDNMIYTYGKNVKFEGNSRKENNNNNLNIFCLNENIKIIFNSWENNIHIRLNKDIIHLCKGGLISKDSLEKIN